MAKTYKELKMNNLRVTTLLLGMIFFSATPVLGLNIVTKEITFKDDPVEILSTWAYVKEEGYSKDLYCWVECKNRSEDGIDALSFCMLFYDVFNEYLDTISAISIGKLPPGNSQKGKWKPNIYKNWSTHTIIIFLDKVRFVDGTIWRRPEIEVTEELGKLKDILFKPEQLEEKRKE